MYGLPFAQLSCFVRQSSLGVDQLLIIMVDKMMTIRIIYPECNIDLMVTFLSVFLPREVVSNTQTMKYQNECKEMRYLTQESVLCECR